MYFETYVSSATVEFSKADLYSLLEQSRRNNTALGVTGMLLYKDGNFMQVVEGDESVVRRLVASIESDPRHKGFMRLLSGHRPMRVFPGWSMGFRDLDAAETTVEGYSEFMNLPLTGREFASDPDKAERLLLTFKRTM